MENYPSEIDALKAELAARDVELGLKKNTINELTAPDVEWGSIYFGVICFVLVIFMLACFVLK